LSCEGGAVKFDLTVDTSGVLRDIQILNTALSRGVTLLKRLGLPEDVEQAYVRIQRLIQVINQMRLAATALQATAFGGPVGGLIAAISFGNLFFSMTDAMEYELRG
jgi:hypothetical protein